MTMYNIWTVTLIVLSTISLDLVYAGKTPRQAIIFGSGSSRRTDCTDYAGRRGHCQLVANCPAFLGLLDKPSPQDVQKIRESVCGYQTSANGRRTPKLCCAETGGQEPLVSTVSPSTGEGQHPNRHLLPSYPRCGSQTDERILGGVESVPGEHPYLCQLGYKVSGEDEVEYNCGGVLINENYVLTAAHCVTDLPSGFTLTTVRVDDFRLNSDDDCKLIEGIKHCSHMRQFNIAEAIAHPQYHIPHRFQNDIALVRLENSDNTHTPICLPFDPIDDLSLQDGQLTVAGFGLTQAFGDPSDVLLKVTVPLYSNARCEEVFERRGAVIGESQMCAGGESGRDSCSGDSGGPLMYNSRAGPPYVAVGIVSYGVSRCGSEDVPGVYTRVDNYIDWILDNIHE